VFDLAISTLLDRAPVAELGPKLRATDLKIHALEQELRRQLAVHASVFGGIETPVVLVYMSIVKDLERLGDYAKNLLDLARDGADFSTLADADDWRRIAGEIAAQITEAAATFRERDVEAARRVVEKAKVLMSDFDRRVTALVRGDDTGPQAVARALACRYLKRVAAHVSNVLTAVINPVDKLDFLENNRAARE